MSVVVLLCTLLIIYFNVCNQVKIAWFLVLSSSNQINQKSMYLTKFKFTVGCSFLVGLRQMFIKTQQDVESKDNFVEIMRSGN